MQFCVPWVIVVTPLDTPGCRGAYDHASRNPVMTGTPGRPLSAELSEQLISVAVDILAEEGWGRLNSDRIAARARAGKAGIYRRWPTMAALARSRGEPLQPRHPVPDAGGSLRERPARRSSPAGPGRWTARSGPWPASSARPGTRRSCAPVSTTPWCARSPRAVAEIGARAAERGEPIDAEPAGAARLGARGLLVAALHGRRRRRDDPGPGRARGRRRPAADRRSRRPHDVRQEPARV